VRRVLAALLACLLLTSCSATQQPDAGPGAGNVDVDTAQLRALKARAGVAACPAAHGSSELPKVTLRCLGGGPDVDLSTLRGPLVVNLFAQWCGPCRRELPYYEALHRKGKGTVRVIGVDYLDTQPAAALQLVRETGVTYPLLADPAGRLRADLKVRGLPGVVFVNEDGTVTTEFRVVKSYAELRGLVQDRLDVRLPA
jgi:thiol-disulfide isomerase/thioredoxin